MEKRSAVVSLIVAVPDAPSEGSPNCLSVRDEGRGVCSVELSSRGTFTGPYESPAGLIQLTGAKLEIPCAEFSANQKPAETPVVPQQPNFELIGHPLEQCLLSFVHKTIHDHLDEGN